MCIYKGCKKRPNFNIEGEYPLYCFAHKKEGMIDVKNHHCIHEGCKTRSNFNIEGEKAMYCAAHKKEGMINVICKTCIHGGCKIYPTFNTEGKKAMYCAAHKKEGMFDVKSIKCIHKGCKIHPSFNLEGENAIYCATHKKGGMVDVKTNKCIHEGCKTRPIFNIEGEKAIYCVRHKLEGMVDVKNNKCIHKGCTIRPIFNIEGEKAIYCVRHKLEGMVDVKNNICKTYLCSTRTTEKYDGYCLYCYINLFPDKPITRNYKTKEHTVIDYIKTKFDNPWIIDKKIDGGCSRRRPDLLLDLIDQIIIVEVDENQHVEYDCICENKRIMELSQDLGHRPIVFIRFNPDEYQNIYTKITSCWGTNKKGIFIVKQSKKEEWIQRLHYLGEMIEYWLKHRTNKTIEIIQLFYDTN